MAADNSSKIGVTIRLEPSASERVDEIIKALKKEGLDDVQLHRRFMMINGSISAERMDALAKIAGVAAVRKDIKYKARGS